MRETSWLCWSISPLMFHRTWVCNSDDDLSSWWQPTSSWSGPLSLAFWKRICQIWVWEQVSSIYASSISSWKFSFSWSIYFWRIFLPFSLWQCSICWGRRSIMISSPLLIHLLSSLLTISSTPSDGFYTISSMLQSNYNVMQTGYSS